MWTSQIKMIQQWLKNMKKEDKTAIIIIGCVIVFAVLMGMSELKTSSTGASTNKRSAYTNTCYWCGKEEECKKYCCQYIAGENPNGSFKFDYDFQYISDKCLNEMRNSYNNKYINIKEVD